MSSGKAAHGRGRPTERRTQVLQELAVAGRTLGTATVVFHTTVAATMGLIPTEQKALELLERFGPLTAGELAERSGLAPASITGLINRLERKGFARRTAHPDDARKVLIEPEPERLARLGALFSEFARSLDTMYAGYTDDQLETILGFVGESVRRLEQATARLSGSSAAGDD